MATPPRPPNEAQRLEALRSYHVMDSAPEAAFDDIVFLVSHICKTPVALVTMLDETRQWFKAKVGTPEAETPRDLAFCSYAILEQDRMMEVEDATRDVRFSANPLVTGDPNIRFYAGVPLVTPDGYALGTLCTLDIAPRQLDDDQRRALHALANEVTTQLELRRTITALDYELRAVRSTLSPPPGVSLTDGLENRVRILLSRLNDLRSRVEAKTGTRLPPR